MPDSNVILTVRFEKICKEKVIMEQSIDNSNDNIQNGVLEYFEIPEELAKELSDLLTKQVVRERLLLQVVGDPVKYNELEAMILPITAKIEAIKARITEQYVPQKYRSVKYMWNYTGYEVDQNKVQILEQ